MIGFCEECRDMVKYNTKEKRMIKDIRGKEIEYIGKVAYCDECGSEIFVAEIRDYNLINLEDTFEEEGGI